MTGGRWRRLEGSLRSPTRDNEVVKDSRRGKILRFKRGDGKNQAARLTRMQTPATVRQMGRCNGLDRETTSNGPRMDANGRGWTRMDTNSERGWRVG